jgi:hypothetical protein
MADEDSGEGGGALLKLETLLLHNEKQAFFSVTYTFLTVVSHEPYHEH